MPQQLPETESFLRQVENNACIQGVWPIARLGRLCEVLNGDSGEIEAKLEFGKEAGVRYIKGRVTASLEVLCQRCMEPLVESIEAEFHLGLISDESETEKLLPELEPYLIEGDEQSIIDLVEDELLLSLPLVSVHVEDCSEILNTQKEQRRLAKEKSNPFAVLKNLKID